MQEGPRSHPIRVLVVVVLTAGLAYFVYRLTLNNREQQSAYLDLFGQPKAQSVSPIPHSQTTLAAPGYTPNLKDLPFDQPGYAPQPEPQGHCSVTLDTKKRNGVYPIACPAGQESVGFACYEPCPDKMSTHPNFPTQCQRCKDFSSSCDFLDMIIQKRQMIGPATECPSSHPERFSGLCYEPCPEGYVPNGNLCLKCG